MPSPLTTHELTTSLTMVTRLLAYFQRQLRLLLTNNFPETPRRLRSVVGPIVVVKHVRVACFLGKLVRPLGNLNQLVIGIVIVKPVRHRSPGDIAMCVATVGP